MITVAGPTRSDPQAACRTLCMPPPGCQATVGHGPTQPQLLPLASSCRPRGASPAVHAGSRTKPPQEWAAGAHALAGPMLPAWALPTPAECPMWPGPATSPPCSPSSHHGHAVHACVWATLSSRSQAHLRHPVLHKHTRPAAPPAAAASTCLHSAQRMPTQAPVNMHHFARLQQSSVQLPCLACLLLHVSLQNKNTRHPAVRPA